MQEILLKIKHFERRLSESLKNNFYLSKPVPFNEKNMKKQKGPGTSGQLLFRFQKKFRKIPLLVVHYLT